MEWAVDLDGHLSRPTYRVEDVVDALAPYAAVVQGEDDGAEIGATMTVEARNAMEAVREATRHLALAAGSRPAWTHIEVQELEARDRELARPLLPELAGVTEFARMLGVSRQRAHDITTTPDFPPPQAALAAGPIWTRSQLETWARTHDRVPGRPGKATA